MIQEAHFGVFSKEYQTLIQKKMPLQCSIIYDSQDISLWQCGMNTKANNTDKNRVRQRQVPYGFTYICRKLKKYKTSGNKQVLVERR